MFIFMKLYSHLKEPEAQVTEVQIHTEALAYFIDVDYWPISLLPPNGDLRGYWKNLIFMRIHQFNLQVLLLRGTIWILYSSLIVIVNLPTQKQNPKHLTIQKRIGNKALHYLS